VLANTDLKIRLIGLYKQAETSTTVCLPLFISEHERRSFDTSELA